MYETVLFSRQCLKSAEKTLTGSPVVINGNLSYKNGDISVTAEKIISLTALKKLKNKKSKVGVSLPGPFFLARLSTY